MRYGIKRYVRLLEAKEDIVRRINEAKERGDQAEADRLEEGELAMILDDLEGTEREMNPTGSRIEDED